MSRYRESRREQNRENNDRLSVRDMSNIQLNRLSGLNDHGRNIDRLLMEREDIFNQDSKMSLDTDSMGRYGEITGNTYEQENVGRGLPLRSQYTIRKPVYDANEHLDFELYDDKPSKLNVKYFDPNSSGSSGFADIHTSMTKISSQVNPVVINSSQIDRLNNNSFYYLFDLFRGNNYVVNGFGLYNLFAALYLSSRGVTEIELKKFFEFPKKDILYKGLSKINDALSVSSHIINIKNFFIVGSDVPYNPYYYDSIRDLCILVRPNTSNPEKDAIKMNALVKRIIGIEMRNVITPENLYNLQLMFLSTAIIHPVWAIPFDRITSGIFFGESKDIKCNYLHSVGKSYGYFEDGDHQLLEMRCDGNEIVMGFLLHKNNMIADIDDLKLHFFISHMKESVLDEIKIPMFTQDLKLRFNNTLKNMGLSSIFTAIISPEFFPEGIVLQDIVQNIKIIIDDTSVKSNESHRGYRTIRKFIANKSFIYYFRLVKTNTILLMGTYQ